MLGNIKWVARALTMKDWGARERLQIPEGASFISVPVFSGKVSVKIFNCLTEKLCVPW